MKKTKLKRVLVLALCLVMLLLSLTGCDNLKEDVTTTDNLANIFEETSTTAEITSDTTEAVTGSADSPIIIEPNTNTGTEMTPAELAQAITQTPAIAVSWDVPEAMEYNGNEITTEVTITNGSFKMEKGFSISLNGVLQECAVEKNGKVSEKSTMPVLVFEADESSTFKISFTPNIGKNGETLEMSLLHSYLPSYRVDDNTQIKVYLNGQLSVMSIANVKLNFKADAPYQTQISTSFSGMKQGEINSVLYKSHYFEDMEENVYNDTYEHSRMAIYDAFDKVYSVEKGVFYDDITYTTHLTVGKSSATPMTVTVYGKPGMKRVSFYLNNQPLPVFDGKTYIDVEIKEEEQVELNILLDTTNLPKYNAIYALIKELNETPDPAEHYIIQSSVCVLEVQ